jgi:hypothetical protein
VQSLQSCYDERGKKLRMKRSNPIQSFEILAFWNVPQRELWREKRS